MIKIVSFLPKTEFSSTKNVIYINKLNNNNNNNIDGNNIDYSGYFKINNKREQKMLNNLNRYNIQNQNFFISKNINNQNKIIFNKTFNFDKEKSGKFSSLNFNDICNNLNDENNDIKTIYNKTGNIIENNINDNIYKMKKEEELDYLMNMLKNLKEQNKRREYELNVIKNKNLNLEKNKLYTNKKIYMDIKNIFNNNENNIKNNNSQINTEDLLNFYKIKLETKTSYTEKIKLLREIYLREKLKNFLVEKTNKVFLENNLLKAKEANDNKIIFDNIYNCVNDLLDDINKIKKNNAKLEINISKKNKEKQMCNYYFNNWLYLLRIKNKEDLKNKIKDLIFDQNYNEIEEIKLYNILMNKKNH